MFLLNECDIESVYGGGIGAKSWLWPLHQWRQDVNRANSYLTTRVAGGMQPDWHFSFYC